MHIAHISCNTQFLLDIFYGPKKKEAKLLLDSPKLSSIFQTPYLYSELM